MSDYRDLPLFAGLRGGERITIDGKTHEVVYIDRVNGALRLESADYTASRVALWEDENG